MKKKPIFVCPSCKFEGVKKFFVSEERYEEYNEPFTVRKKTRVCEKCEHQFVPIEETSRREKLLKLMIVSLFLSKCDKSRKELTKINKKLQKISKGLRYDDTAIREKFIDFSHIDKNEIRKLILKNDNKLKNDEIQLQKEIQLLVDSKIEFIANNPGKHRENTLKQSKKDKNFIFENPTYLIELVFDLTSELGDKSEIEILNDEGKVEKITLLKLDKFQDEIIENQHNLQEYQAIYDKELVIVREMLKDEEEEDNVEELSMF